VYPARQAATASATAIWVLPTPGGPSSAALPLSLGERQGGQVPDFPRVEFGLVGEVVFVQRLVVGHLGDPQRVPQPSFLADGGFFFQDQVKEVQVAHLAGVGALHVLGERLGQVRQPEFGRGGPDPGGDQFAHVLSFGLVAGIVVKGRVPVAWS
jgi:hypothetical protein